MLVVQTEHWRFLIMCQEQYKTKRKKFKKLTYKNRVKIESLCN